jgi:hypothetical protein
VKNAKKRNSRKHPIETLGKERPSFAKVLASMPNVGLDTDFARSNAVDEMRQFMREREAESTKESVDLKELVGDGRA